MEAEFTKASHRCLRLNLSDERQNLHKTKTAFCLTLCVWGLDGSLI